MAVQLTLTLPGKNEALRYESDDSHVAACSIDLQEQISGWNQREALDIFSGTRTTTDGIQSKVFVKASTMTEDEADLEAEAANYSALAHLQGTVIPVNFGRFQRVSGTSHDHPYLRHLLVLESSDEWEDLQYTDFKLLPFTVRKNIMEAALALHRAGFFHQDGEFLGEHILRHRGDDSIRLISLRDIDHKNCPYIGRRFVPGEDELCERLRETCWLIGICKPAGMDGCGKGIDAKLAHDMLRLEKHLGGFQYALNILEIHVSEFFPLHLPRIEDAIRAWRAGGRKEEGKSALRYILPEDCVKDPVA
ncbi:hypothetical protein FA95DRAFT_1680463 [Auriscalpium vulgare]|uniref:Uncharacterized protein n=1 Tax=Auriscalpium vulgare TaxID=40419 RepID=A0ACB8RMX9_9AGAM|nr:hypothetical protein FA95DRAFT_1680463 [Auriscalpium vulgare]